MNNETLYLMSIMAARRALDECGYKSKTIDYLPGRAAGHKNEIPRPGRRDKDSGTPKRARATFAKQPKDSIARSNTMRREIINQALMYTIVSLFVFMMMPLLRFVS